MRPTGWAAPHGCRDRSIHKSIDPRPAGASIPCAIRGFLALALGLLTVLPASALTLEQASFAFPPNGSGIAFLQGPSLSSTCEVKAKLAFVSATGEILVADTSDSLAVQLTTGAGATGPAELSPDGTKVLFVKSSGGIFLMSTTQGSTATQLPATGSTTQDSNPTWSFDGGKIAFERGGQIFVMASAGASAQFVIDGVEPAWAPDGGQLVFVSGAGNANLMASAADGSGARLLCSQPSIHHPRWSADGSAIVFASGQAGAVFTVPAGGGTPTRICDAGTNPEWLPDSAGVSFLLSTGAIVALRPAASTGTQCTLLFNAGPYSWARTVKPRRFNLFFLGRGRLQSAISSGKVPVSSLEIRTDGSLPPRLSVVTLANATSGPGTLTRISGAVQITADSDDVAAWSPIAFSPDGTNILFTDNSLHSHLISLNRSGMRVALAAAGVTRFIGFVKAKGIVPSMSQDFIVAIDASSGDVLLFRVHADGTIASTTAVRLTAEGSLSSSCLHGLALGRHSQHLVAAASVRTTDSFLSDLFLLPQFASMAGMPLVGLLDPRVARITDSGVIPPGMLSINPAVSADGRLVLFANETGSAGFELGCDRDLDNDFGALSLTGATHFQAFLSPTLQVGTKQAVPVLPGVHNQFQASFNNNGMMLGLLQDTDVGHADSAFQIFLAKVRFRRHGKGLGAIALQGGAGDEFDLPFGSEESELAVDEEDDVDSGQGLPGGLRRVGHVRKLVVTSVSGQGAVTINITLVFTPEEFTQDELSRLTPCVFDEGTGHWKSVAAGPVDAVEGVAHFQVTGHLKGKASADSLIPLGVAGTTQVALGVSDSASGSITAGGVEAGTSGGAAAGGVSSAGVGGGGCAAPGARAGRPENVANTLPLLALAVLLVSRSQRAQRRARLA